MAIFTEMVRGWVRDVNTQCEICAPGLGRNMLFEELECAEGYVDDAILLYHSLALLHDVGVSERDFWRLIGRWRITEEEYDDQDDSFCATKDMWVHFV
jgi:hypothetical protein